MSPTRETKPGDAISPRLIQTVCARIQQGKRVRRELPGWGRIHIDRPLPFLCVYRRPQARTDPATEKLATSEASYLIASGNRGQHSSLSELIQGVTEELVDQFGACMLLELWSTPPASNPEPVSTATLVPEFKILTSKQADNDTITDEFVTSLNRVKIGGRKPVVTRAVVPKTTPKSLSSLLPPDTGCLSYGLEVAPIYRDPITGEVFPSVLRHLRRGLTIALRRVFYEFAHKHTTHHPGHFHSLGRRAVVKAVWEADRLLAEACDQFDFLLHLSPVNGEEAWQEFRRCRYDRKPVFHYRPLPAEPVVLKRNLYRAPVELVEDPALARILREKLDEVDRQITLLQHRNTPRFLPESVQLFGGVEDPLFDMAKTILRTVPPRSRQEPAKEQLSAEQFAERARHEIDFLRKQHPDMNARVEVRKDVTGLIVSEGNLLVGFHTQIPLSRVDATLQHEVGTHVLTYHNGRSQRFRQLYTGLAGYDALQEGLAVLSEYLVGGLSRPRIRLLAARVVAARGLVEGASFLDVHRELTRDYGFSKRIAFAVAMRTYRGGGLTKDAVYLRGLRQILDYIGKGGDLAPLFVGKIASQHIPIVRELQWRGVLGQPPMSPRYVSSPSAQRRLEGLRCAKTVADLIERTRR